MKSKSKDNSITFKVKFSRDGFLPVVKHLITNSDVNYKVVGRPGYWWRKLLNKVGINIHYIIKLKIHEESTNNNKKL